MIDIENIIVGESYAARFRVDCMLDETGKPFTGAPDQTLASQGEYEGLGVLITRDVENKLVKLRDVETLLEFVVPFSDLWEVDHAQSE